MKDVGRVGEVNEKLSPAATLPIRSPRGAPERAATSSLRAHRLAGESTG